MATFDPFVLLRYSKAAAYYLLVPELLKNVTWLAKVPESTQKEQQGTKRRAAP